MDTEKIKLIIRNMELLIDSLKVEMYSDMSSHNQLENMQQPFVDYDEIYEDD
jgi:hypothetical protein